MCITNSLIHFGSVSLKRCFNPFVCTLTITTPFFFHCIHYRFFFIVFTTVSLITMLSKNISITYNIKTDEFIYMGLENVWVLLFYSSFIDCWLSFVLVWLNTLKIKLYSKGRQLFRGVELPSHASKSCLSRKKV